MLSPWRLGVIGSLTRIRKTLKALFCVEMCRCHLISVRIKWCRAEEEGASVLNEVEAMGLANDRDRCGARTRSGRPCAAFPVKGKRRCRMHGGAPGSGAPRGNRNAVTHGRTTAAEITRRKTLRRLMTTSQDFLTDFKQMNRAWGRILPAGKCHRGFPRQSWLPKASHRRLPAGRPAPVRRAVLFPLALPVS